MHIIWRLMFRVNDRASLDVCLKPILPLFGSNHSLEDCKPYWKIPELWECTITTPAQGSSTADQVLHALITANQLAAGWLILGSLTPESPADFTGVCAKKQSSTHMHFPTLEWASFDFVTDLTASK